MATKTLTGYIAGSSGANWLVSAACKAQFDLMAAAAIKPATEGGCGATLALADGYVSRYQAIREIIAIKGYSTDTTVEGNVKDLTKNNLVTDDQWNQLEQACNADNSYINIYKTSRHAYLTDGLLLAVGGKDNTGATYGCKPSEDLRRTGDVIKITANGKGVMSSWNEADWMLLSGSQFGFHFLGPDQQTFAYNPTFKFGPVTLENNIKYLKSRMFFLMKAADLGQIPTNLPAGTYVKSTGWNNDEFKNTTWNNPVAGAAYYDNWAAKFTTPDWKPIMDSLVAGGDPKIRAQACAITFGQPWLFGMERIY